MGRKLTMKWIVFSCKSRAVISLGNSGPLIIVLLLREAAKNSGQSTKRGGGQSGPGHWEKITFFKALKKKSKRYVATKLEGEGGKGGH